MDKPDASIFEHQIECLNKLREYSKNSKLDFVLLMASYCEDTNSKCNDHLPCEECLKMCNIAVIDKKAIKEVICGYEFLKDFK